MSKYTQLHSKKTSTLGMKGKVCKYAVLWNLFWKKHRIGVAKLEMKDDDQKRVKLAYIHQPHHWR